MPSLNETQEELLRINKQIGERVRALRRERGLTLKEMEQRMLGLGWTLTSSRLSKLENGLCKWNIASLSSVASVFEVSLAELVGFKSAESPSGCLIINDIEHQVLNVWRSNQEISLIEWSIKRIRERESISPC